MNLVSWLFHNLNYWSIASERPKPLIWVNDMVAWDSEKIKIKKSLLNVIKTKKKIEKGLEYRTILDFMYFDYYFRFSTFVLKWKEAEDQWNKQEKERGGDWSLCWDDVLNRIYQGEMGVSAGQTKLFFQLCLWRPWNSISVDSHLLYVGKIHEHSRSFMASQVPGIVEAWRVRKAKFVSFIIKKREG